VRLVIKRRASNRQAGACQVVWRKKITAGKIRGRRS
jgi:hypothetical protein